MTTLVLRSRPDGFMDVKVKGDKMEQLIKAQGKLIKREGKTLHYIKALLEDKGVKIIRKELRLK
jgi:hypothetical protein